MINLKLLPLPLDAPYADFPQTAPERTINLFLETIGGEKRLRRTPGLKLFGNTGALGGMRVVFTFNGPTDSLFCVCGNKFMEYVNGSFVSRGTLATDTGYVSISSNVSQLLIADSVNYWGYTPGNPSSFQIVNPPFTGASAQSCFISNRICVIQPGTPFFWCCNEDDVTVWSGTAGADEESVNGPLVAIASFGQYLIILSANGYEIWQDMGLPDFPFRRIQLGNLIGCAAPASVAVFAQSVFFIGSSKEGQGIVYEVASGQPTRISDTNIERIISQMPTYSDAVGFIYQENGNVMYRLSFSTGNKTLFCNLTDKKWYEAQYRDPVSSVVGRRPEISMCVFQGKNLVADYRNGNVYELSTQYFTDNGAPVVHEFVLPAWPKESVMRTKIPPFQLLIDMGNTPSGSEAPKAMFSFSENGGVSFGNELFKDLGKTGEYEKRIVWHGLGSSYRRHVKVRLTGNQDFVIRGAGYLIGSPV